MLTEWGKRANCVLVLCLLMGSNIVDATERYYELQVAGKELGIIREHFALDINKGYRISQQLTLSESGWWGTFELSSELVEIHDHQGVLQKASNNVVENGKTYWTKVELHADEYLAFRGQIRSDKEQQDEEDEKIAMSAIASLIPGASEVLAVGSGVFGEDDKSVQRRFSRDSFDTSLLGLPTFWRRSSNTLPEKIRIFDSEEMLVFDGVTELKSTEVKSIEGRETLVHHFRLVEEQGENFDVWLADDGSFSPYFLKISGLQDGDLVVLSYRPDVKEKH